MYQEYWGLKRNPFDSVPDPEMYFSSHSTVESTVAELLFAIEEGNECLAVVVGEVGLGKTMALRVVLNELDQAKYRVAFVTNPDITFVQLLREIVGQLKGEPCTIRDKEGLLEEFNRLLFETTDSGGKVLIFIDEANSMKTANLESLRLLTNMQEDTRNLFTIVLAGQPKLGKMLEEPRRANLFQRIGVYSRLNPLDSVELVRDYVEHRLERAEASGNTFTDEAYQAVFEHSKGIPRLINRVCKLALKAGETNRLASIDAEVVREIAARFEPARRKKSRTPEQPESRSSAAEVEQKTESRPDEASAETRRNNVHELPQREHKEDERTPYEHTSTASQFLASVTPIQPRIEASDEVPRAVSIPQNGHEHREPKELPQDTYGVSIPGEVLEALRKLPDHRQRLRLAGQLAARQIQEHPEKYSGAKQDPVKAWDELRTEILRNVS